jgi:hypothetical protein
MNRQMCEDLTEIDNNAAKLRASGSRAQKNPAHGRAFVHHIGADQPAAGAGAGFGAPCEP